MIIVDTSVWIEASRRPQGDEAGALRSLLDHDEVALALPVRIEFLAGVVRRDRQKVRRALAALPLVMPTDQTWDVAEKWRVRAQDAGYTFSLSDLLIAALTDELTGLVWSLDTDFEAMEKLGFVRCY